MRIRKAAAAACVVLSACSSMTTMRTVQEGATVDVKESKQHVSPRTEEFGDTSFGNYEFCARVPQQEPFYGVLPLEFHGGYLALDILFFAPATFFNLRGVFPYYEFDTEKHELRYREKETDSWVTYRPTEDEVAHAKKYFEKRTPPC